jgi:hypothetical protein
VLYCILLLLAIKDSKFTAFYCALLHFTFSLRNLPA